MALYSGVSAFQIPSFVGMDVDDVEDIFQRLIENDILEDVRVRKEVQQRHGAGPSPATRWPTSSIYGELRSISSIPREHRKSKLFRAPVRLRSRERIERGFTVRAPL